MTKRLQGYLTCYKKIFRLGLPILIGQLGMIIVGFADNIMVGRYSTEALASASFVNNLFNVAIFACIGFTYGLTPIVASLFSGNHAEKIGTTVRIALWINIIFSLIVSSIMLGFYFNIERMGQPQELIPIIKPYFLIYLCGIIPITVFNVFAQWSYGINNTRMPMWIILGADLFNIFGNYVFIYGHFGIPEMGLFGAGISTLISRIICPLAIILIFLRKNSFSGYRKGFLHSKATVGVVGKINRTSWPVAMQMTMESGSFTFAAVVSGWLGAIPLASFQVIVIIGTLGFCIYYSMASAVSVLVANAHGQNDAPLMRRTAFAGYHLILMLATISSMIFIFFGQSLVEAFTEDARVISLTMTLILPLVLYQLGDATQINFANALRGTSRVMPMLWIAFVSYIIIGAPATYLLAIPMNMGVYGVILSFSASLFIAAACFLYFFLNTTRKQDSR